MAILTDVANKQISVPFTENEWDRFNQFIMKEGLKKGPIVRKAVLAYLDRFGQERDRDDH